jgi:hypothetical protein
LLSDCLLVSRFENLPSDVGLLLKGKPLHLTRLVVGLFPFLHNNLIFLLD